MTYTHVVRAWREGAEDSERLPVPCPDESSARAMFAHALRKGSDFDHAELCEKTSTGNLRVVETGHRESSALTRTAAGTINQALVPMAEQFWRNVWDTNTTEPYVHETYARWDAMLNASLVLVTNGDVPHAHAIRWALTDSGEDVTYHLRWERNALCYDAGTMSKEDYDATLRWAVECEENGDTWTDAFATREEADRHAADLVANTTVVDRHAVQVS